MDSSSRPLTPHRPPTDWVAWLGEVVLLAALYTGFGSLGLELAHLHESATLIWPPTGLALAAMLIFGRRLWPGVLIGAFLLNTGGTDLSLPSSLAIAIGNTLEAVVGVTLMRRVGMQLTLAQMRDVAAFLVIGVLGCTTLSPAIGVSALWLAGSVPPGDFGMVWMTWWFGDMGGALLFAPPLLMFVYGRPAFVRLFTRLEFWLAFSLLLAAVGGGFLSPRAGAADNLGLARLLPIFPLLVWVGTRLGSRGAAMASFVIISGAVLGTVVGTGPFASQDPTGEMLLLWSFLMVIGFTVFTLASVVEERDEAGRLYLAGEAERLAAEKERALLLERGRLTREMHDGLGGQLISVLSMVERGQAAPSEIAESIRRALDDIRIVIDSLDPETTDLPTSFGKLRARLTPLLERNGIRLIWSTGDMSPLARFSPEASLHILRVVQEAVTNAMRHAAPKHVEVSVEWDASAASGLRVAVRDDGCGLDPESVAGRGLRNMQRRASELGGELRIRDAGPGTLVELIVPAPVSG